MSNRCGHWPAVLQPRSNGADVGQPPPGDRAARSHLDGIPLAPVHDREPELVGHIVTGKNRHTPGKRRLLHKRGNGLAFDWSILKNAARPFMLAGGLTPDNVAEAIRVTQAAMVDVSSGVESSPGMKDPAKIAKFIEAAKAAR